MRRSQRRFPSSMRKGGQLELLAPLTTFLALRCKEAKQRNLSWRSLAHIEPLRISFLLDRPITSCPQSWSCSVVPVEVSCRGLNAASTMSFLSNILLSNDYVSPKEIRVGIQLDLVIIMQFLTLLTLHSARMLFLCYPAYA